MTKNWSVDRAEACDWKPLSDPIWGERTKPVEFPSLIIFQIFLQELHAILEAELEGRPYNTIGNFLEFYKHFRSQDAPFWEFYHHYDAEILPESLSCVGLACCLIDTIMNSSLGYVCPELKTALFLASSEEMVMDIDMYCSCSPPSSAFVVKEHVLVALKVLVEGRSGVVILDPGYHVNIPVVVMSDCMYPHTGWFVLSETPKVKREYRYIIEGDFIQWAVRETRNNKTKCWKNLIYIKQRFLSHISVSEKRNLVFNFRTLVVRNKREPVAGLYCNLEGDEKFTLFYQDNVGKRVEVKIPFKYFYSERTNNQFESAIADCANQVRYNTTLLSDLITQIIDAYFDPDFMPYVQEVNQVIEE